MRICRTFSLILLFAAIVLPSLMGCRYVERRVTARELREHVTTLAADELAGRETGEPGVMKAEQYIADLMASFGLEPLPGEDDHFVEFDLYRHTYDLERTGLTVQTPRGPLVAEPGVDFKPFWFSPEASVSAPVVFAGYGIIAPENDWNDYEGLDVRGKVVLILRHEPGNNDPESVFDGTDTTRHSYFVTKARTALRQGAAGMLLFTDPLSERAGADDLRLTGSLTLDRDSARRRGDRINITSARIGQSFASRILDQTGYDLLSLQQAVDAGLRPAEVSLEGVTATLSVGPLGEPQPEAARNVAGFLPGRDPELAGEWIVVGGHHDHLGAIPEGTGDLIFNGADDNASGVSGVLELAEHLALGRPLRRSVAFFTFGAEEMGLLGSRALFENELIPGDRVVFMMNMDMIGRNPEEAVQVFGAGFGLDLEPLLEEASELGGDLEWSYKGMGDVPANSDYGPFLDAGIPFVSFFTGIHDDYHSVTDHADLLDYDRMRQIVRFADHLLIRLDSQETLRD